MSDKKVLTIPLPSRAVLAGFALGAIMAGGGVKAVDSDLLRALFGLSPKPAEEIAALPRARPLREEPDFVRLQTEQTLTREWLQRVEHKLDVALGLASDPQLPPVAWADRDRGDRVAAAQPSK